MTTPKPTMVIAGASGVIGQHLIAAASPHYRLRILTRANHVRQDSQKAIEIFTWDPAAVVNGRTDAVRSLSSVLENSDVLVNLAGSSIGQGRLTQSRQNDIVQSRILATAAIGQAWLAASAPPNVWLQASAIGFYGNAGEQVLDEAGPMGQSFLAEVCHAWEAEAAKLNTQSHTPPRMVIARIGLVLAQDALAWQKMLQPIQLGLAGALGTGKQWYAWIDADDVAKALLFLAKDATASGVFNFTAPKPVRQLALFQDIAKKIKRPAWLPTPAFMLRLLLGDIAANELLLSSCYATPTKLLTHGFTFESPTITHMLDKLLPMP